PSVAAPQPVGEDPVRNPEGLRGHMWISPSANEGAEIALELCRQAITLDGHGSNLHSENRLRALPGLVGRCPAAHAAALPSRRSRVIEGIAHAPTAGAWRVRRTESQPSNESLHDASRHGQGQRTRAGASSASEARPSANGSARDVSWWKSR